MLDNVSWPKVLIVAGGLAVWVFGGMWIVGAYVLGGVEQSVGEFRAETNERLGAREQEDNDFREELVAAMRELRGEVAALRKEVGGLGDRVVASNGKVGDRVDILRKELAGAIRKQGERFDMTVARFDHTDGFREDFSFFDQGSFKQPPKGNVAPVAPPTIADAQP
jgi:hypothetical protein